MATRDIIFNSCTDACRTVTTDRLVEGAPVYRCTGCDSEWIELDERTPEGIAAAERAASAAPAVPTDAATTPAAPDQTPEPPAESPAADAGEWTPMASPDIPADAVVPTLMQTVLDARDVRELAEFYRALLGLYYRRGDAPPFHGGDDSEWLVLTHRDGTRALAFRADEKYVAPTWPKAGVATQAHLDLSVPDVPSLHAACARAVALGARVLADRATHSDDALFILADPAGHPFCIVVE